MREPIRSFESFADHSSTATEVTATRHLGARLGRRFSSLKERSQALRYTPSCETSLVVDFRMLISDSVKDESLHENRQSMTSASASSRLSAFDFIARLCRLQRAPVATCPTPNRSAHLQHPSPPSLHLRPRRPRRQATRDRSAWSVLPRLPQHRQLPPQLQATIRPSGSPSPTDQHPLPPPRGAILASARRRPPLLPPRAPGPLPPNSHPPLSPSNQSHRETLPSLLRRPTGLIPPPPARRSMGHH